jgi:hypothetical protein
VQLLASSPGVHVTVQFSVVLLLLLLLLLLLNSCRDATSAGHQFAQLSQRAQAQERSIDRICAVGTAAEALKTNA